MRRWLGDPIDEAAREAAETATQRATREAAEAARSSRLVPGGGLAAHELAGGHTILRHVGRTEDQLRARLDATPSLDFASTYLDREIAEAAISEAIEVNETGITRWLQTNDAKLPFDHTYGEPIGVTLPREAHESVVVSSLRVVLLRDASNPLGYRILTSFPQLPSNPGP